MPEIKLPESYEGYPTKELLEMWEQLQNGGLPKGTPKEKISDRASISFPSMCSGDMYAAVPIVLEVLVNLADPRNLASPKSITLT